MAPDDLIVREYVPEDKEAILTLLREHMGFAQVDDAFWRWKFGKGGAAGKPLGLVGAVGGKAVGFCSFFPVRFEANGVGLTGWEAADDVVHREYRRRGLFSRMKSEALPILDENEKSFTYGFPSEMSHGWYLKTGYEHVSTLPYFVFVPDITALLGRKLPNALAEIVSRTLTLWRSPERFVRKYTPERHGQRIAEVHAFPEDFHLPGSVEGKDLVLVERDRQYLNWRYCGHPWNRYEIFVASNGERYTGYLVLRGINLVDISARTPSVFGVLVGTAVRRFLERGVLVAHAYLQCDETRRQILRDAGFLEYRLKRRVLGAYPQQQMMVRPGPGMDPKIARALLSRENWYFTSGDVALGM